MGVETALAIGIPLAIGAIGTLVQSGNRSGISEAGAQKLQNMQQAATAVGQYRPGQIDARMKAMQQQMSMYQGASNIMNSLYGGGRPPPNAGGTYKPDASWQHTPPPGPLVPRPDTFPHPDPSWPPPGGGVPPGPLVPKPDTFPKDPPPTLPPPPDRVPPGPLGPVIIPPPAPPPDTTTLPPDRLPPGPITPRTDIPVDPPGDSHTPIGLPPGPIGRVPITPTAPPPTGPGPIRPSFPGPTEPPPFVPEGIMGPGMLLAPPPQKLNPMIQQLALAMKRSA